jgi:hypothetical protein
MPPAALERARDQLTGESKGEPGTAAFSGTGVRDAAGQTRACRALTGAAERLAAGRRPAGGRAAPAHARARRAHHRRAWET